MTLILLWSSESQEQWPLSWPGPLVTPLSLPGLRLGPGHQSHTQVFLAKLILSKSFFFSFLDLLNFSTFISHYPLFRIRELLHFLSVLLVYIKYNPYKPFLNVKQNSFILSPAVCDHLAPPSLMKLRSSMFVSPLCWPVTAGPRGTCGPPRCKNNSLVKIPTLAPLSRSGISRNIKLIYDFLTTGRSCQQSHTSSPRSSTIRSTSRYVDI